MNYIHGKITLVAAILSLINLMNFYYLFLNYGHLHFMLYICADENEERSMVEPASLENPKVKELQEVNDNI